MTRQEFRNAMKGRKVTIEAGQSEFWVAITKSEAMALYDFTNGNLAYDLIDRGEIVVSTCAEERFGMTGDMTYMGFEDAFHND